MIKEKSNKREDNIWESEITLIKAISQQVERENEFLKERLEELSSYSRFSIENYERVEIFYPIIVFEGNMYEATFTNDNIVLFPREYLRLQFDYHSGNYNGKYFIDVVKKEKFPSYLNEVTYDLEIFDKRRKEMSSGYEKGLLRYAKKYYLEKRSSR